MFRPTVHRYAAADIPDFLTLLQWMADGNYELYKFLEMRCDKITIGPPIARC